MVVGVVIEVGFRVAGFEPADDGPAPDEDAMIKEISLLRLISQFSPHPWRWKHTNTRPLWWYSIELDRKVTRIV